MSSFNMCQDPSLLIRPMFTTQWALSSELKVSNSIIDQCYLVFDKLSYVHLLSSNALIPTTSLGESVGFHQVNFHRCIV